MFAAFVFAAMLAAGILKVLGYVDWSWWLISSPFIAWVAFQLVAVLIYLVASFRLKSGFEKRQEEIRRAKREAAERRREHERR